MSSEFSMPASMQRIRTEAIVVYLESQGWKQRTCRYENRLYFEGEIHAGGQPYQLYLPTTPDVPKYRTLLQRAIYKLSGIEEREPSEIVRDIFARQERQDAAEASDLPQRHLIRIRNSGQNQLRIRVASRHDDYRLLPDESIELVYQRSGDGATEIEHTGTSIVIRDDK